VFFRIILVFCALFAANAPAIASCGAGKTPTYDDIQAVQYARTECFGKCPSYKVEFSTSGSYYVGGLRAPRHGNYAAPYDSSVLEHAVDVVRRHDFFSINYDSSILVSDVPHLIVVVSRCGVTTKLDWPSYQHRQDIEGLMKDLDAITDGIRWQKSN